MSPRCCALLIRHTLVSILALLVLAACNDGERFRVVLDRAQQQNLDYDSITGVDSIALAAAYFDSHGTPNEQMFAHYLLGCAYRDMGEAPAALQSYQEAVDCADTTSSDCDYRRLMSIYGQMADIFHAQNLPEDELEICDKYGQLALKIQDTLLYIRNLELYVKPYFLLGDTVSMLRSLKQAQQLYINHGYYQEADAIYPVIIFIYIERDSLQKAKELMDIFESRSGLFDSEGNLSKGRGRHDELKGLFYLKNHQLDSAEVRFRRLLLENSVSSNAEAYKGLLAVYKEKADVDSMNKYVVLFEKAVCKERDDIRTHAIHQMHSLYNYHRFLEKANAESRKAAQVKYYLILSMFLIAVIIFIAIIIVLNLTHKKRMREEEADALRRDYMNAVEKRN